MKNISMMLSMLLGIALALTSVKAGHAGSESAVEQLPGGENVQKKLEQLQLKQLQEEKALAQKLGRVVLYETTMVQLKDILGTPCSCITEHPYYDRPLVRMHLFTYCGGAKEVSLWVDTRYKRLANGELDEDEKAETVKWIGALVTRKS